MCLTPACVQEERDEWLEGHVLNMLDSKEACNAAFLAIWTCYGFDRQQLVANYCMWTSDAVIRNIRKLVEEEGTACLHLLYASQVLAIIDERVSECVKMQINCP